MVIKNGYDARLAKLAGDENVTIPAPRNSYEKHLDDIAAKGGGEGGLPEASASDAGKTIVTDGENASWSDRGYSYSEGYNVVYNDSVTTEDDPEYPVGYGQAALVAETDVQPPAEIKITVDGTVYILEGGDNGFYGAQPDYDHGGYDWSEYSFSVEWGWNPYVPGGYINFYTETTGSYAVKLEVFTKSITLDPAFVNAIPIPSELVFLDGTTGTLENVSDIADILSERAKLPILVANGHGVMTGTLYEYYYYSGPDVQGYSLKGYYFSNGFMGAVSTKHVAVGTGVITDYTPQEP